MTLSPRVRANRRNAQASTGPRTLAGKARSAKNALRHGLNVPPALDPALSEEIDRLAEAIAPDGPPSVLQAARRIAEAEVDVIRARRARIGVLTDEEARLYPVDAFNILLKMVRLEKRTKRGVDISEKMSQLMDRLELAGRVMPLEEGLDFLVIELAKLDRYEKRALSRRNRAIRQYDRLTALLRSSAANSTSRPATYRVD